MLLLLASISDPIPDPITHFETSSERPGQGAVVLLIAYHT